MTKHLLSIFPGIWWLQVSAALPVWAGVGWLVAAVALALLVFCWRADKNVNTGANTNASAKRSVLALRALELAAALILGYGYAAWRADLRMADALDSALEGQDVSLIGVVASLPDDNGDGPRFVFRVERLENAARVGVPERVLLSWYRGRGSNSSAATDPPALWPGERWRLTARLRRPHGSAVPGGFDYEAWLLERGLRATGYVRGGGERLDADSGFVSAVHRLRARIRQTFEAALPEAPYRGILIALAVGDQGAIPAEQWEILRRTGTQHLVAISGLHVSLAALLAGGLAAVLWRRSSWLALRCPARQIGAVAGLAAAVAYALLAGLGIPTQRALVMLAVAALALSARRESSARNVLALALAAVLAIDPWAVLAAGFWLSFGAVATILLVMGGRSTSARGWRQAVRLQLAITLATIPALAALFQGFSIVSPLANAFAIPAVSFAITPLTLAATILPFDWPLERAHMLTAWMMQALHWLSSSPLALREQPLPPPWLLATAMAAAILLILPRGTPGRLAALALIGGFLCWQPERPRSGDFRATVLDVGQGLAIHVQTAHHDLLYDSGPLYGAASDAGERVVTPYLRALGVRRLDKAMISHDDADHAGGLESVRARVTVAETIAGDAGGATYEIEAPPERSAWNARGARLAPVYGTPCISGLRWRWDEVDFTVLAPDGLSGKRRDNAESCVLRISAAGGASLLLTGDMESSGENRLLEHLGDALASTAVVAGHHGSRSSSSPAFVAAVRPDVAIFSAGYRNRYGHPHPVVLSRWAVAGARNLRTDGEGSVLLASEGEKVKAVGWRELHPRYWHGR